MCKHKKSKHLNRKLNEDAVRWVQIKANKFHTNQKNQPFNHSKDSDEILEEVTSNDAKERFPRNT